MRPDIHPNYQPVVFMDTTTGYKFLSGSTKTSNETVEWEDGNTYPLIRVEISSAGGMGVRLHGRDERCRCLHPLPARQAG